MIRFGAVLRNRKPYGAFQCGLQISSILRCRSVLWYILRCGAVRFRKLGILRCGSWRFSEISNLTVRFSKIRNPTLRLGTVSTSQKSYGAVRRGSPLNGFSYGAVPLPVRETVQHHFFPTVHRVNKPYKNAVSYGPRTFLVAWTKPPFFYCLSTVQRTQIPYKPVDAYGFLTFFFTSTQSKQQRQQR